MAQSLIEVAKDLVVQLGSMDPNSRLADLLHEDAALITPGSTFGAILSGKKVIVEYFNNDVYPMFDHVLFTPSNIFVDEKQSVVTIEWGSQLKPKGRDPYENSGVWIIKIENGLVCEIREYFDTEQVVRHVT
jgi:ketosteroid isomerase-like protein